MEYMNDVAAYEIGTRTLHDHLQRHRISVIEAHHRHQVLCYLPQVFMPLDVVKDGLGRVHRALRPGGWIFELAIAARATMCIRPRRAFLT